MDPRTEALLGSYRKEVEKLARGIYLQTAAIKREIDISKINPEDKSAILVHCINILSKNSQEESKP